MDSKYGQGVLWDDDEGLSVLNEVRFLKKEKGRGGRGVGDILFSRRGRRRERREGGGYYL